MKNEIFIHLDPNRWKVWKTGKRLRNEWVGEEIVGICYGSLDKEGVYDLEMYMRRSIYEKVMTGEYNVSLKSKSLLRLVLVDKAGNEIPRVGGLCY